MTTVPHDPRAGVRATVTSHRRRADLTLPGAVTVADLLPELARCVGLLDARTARRGFELVTRAGRVLSPGAGLIAQGVEDGAVLTVAARGDHAPPRVYDDVVEAMADAVERDLVTWPARAGRGVLVAAAVVTLVLGAAALAAVGGTVAAVASLVAAVVLTSLATVLSRVRGERVVAVAVAWTGVVHGAVGGALLAPAGLHPVAAAAATAALAGLAGLVGLDEGRVLLLPPVVVGTGLAASELVGRTFTSDPTLVPMTCLVVVVVVGSVFPWLALGVTGCGSDQLAGIADPTAAPAVVDPVAVVADARLGHEVLLALSTSAGILLALVAPVAAARGPAGTLVAVTCCTVVLLRTRQHRVASEVLVGLGLGLLATAAVVVSVLWHHPAWRGEAAVLVMAAGTVALACSLLPLEVPAWRRARWGDLAETTALACLPPFLLLATGVVDAVRG